MAFYKELSQDERYDLIFPMRETTVDFLATSFAKGSSVLDVAMGTGNYTKALKDKGFKVIGLEFDHAMYQKVIDKGVAKTEDLILGSMVDVEEIAPKVDNVFCIGNSLVHLPSLEDCVKTIEGMYAIMSEGGKLVLQIINYDRIISHNVTSLPTINVDEAKMSFERNYKYNGKYVEFEGIISIDGQVISQEMIELLPIQHDFLVKSLKNTGFTGIKVYGGFNRAVFDIEHSIPLVIEASK